MKIFHPSNYGLVFAELIPENRLRPLGPGLADGAMRATLEGCTLEAAFAPQRIHDWDMAQGCLAGLWLIHDFLDESHTNSQALDTSTGGYWHGLMHRREPDFDNAKYWFRRVGRHPVFEPLREAAAEIAGATETGPAANFLTTQTAWDPFAFVDLCRECIDSSSPLETLCRQIQQREWEILFDYCYQQAGRARSYPASGGVGTP
jgi:hypothetical protein